jgi:hypothetical protein
MRQNWQNYYQAYYLKNKARLLEYKRNWYFKKGYLTQRQRYLRISNPKYRTNSKYSGIYFFKISDWQEYCGSNGSASDK